MQILKWSCPYHHPWECDCTGGVWVPFAYGEIEPGIYILTDEGGKQ